MGLDLVELVMGVEDHFGVHLPDEECARVHTVADLASLVTSKLEITRSTCPTSQTFYRVRKALVESGFPREAIRPETRLASFEGRNRRRAWRKLQRQNETPRLARNLRKAQTVGDLVRLISPSVWPSDPNDRILAEHQILNEVRDITAEQLGLPLERVLPESEFVKDLGAG